MTVTQLIERLQELPKRATVMVEDDAGQIGDCTGAVIEGAIKPVVVLTAAGGERIPNRIRLRGGRK